MKDIDSKLFPEVPTQSRFSDGTATIFADKTKRFTLSARRRVETVPDMVDRSTISTDIPPRIAVIQSVPLSVLNSVLEGLAVFADSITVAVGNVTEVLMAVLNFGRDFCEYLRNFPTYFETKILMVPEPVYHEI